MSTQAAAAWPPEPGPLGSVRTDVMAFGEALVLLQPPLGALLHSTREVEMHVAGADVNVCAAIAALGGRATLCTRLGADPLGAFVEREVGRLGVELSAELEPAHPTGVYFREVRPDALRRPYYYRAGSAASRLGPGDAHRAPRDRPRAVVVSGLTAALGPGPRSLLEHVGRHAAAWGAALVVDANLRPQLGHLDDAVSCLRALLPATGLLALGRDEALTIFGTDDPPAAVAAAHAAGCREVVLKGGAEGCWYTGADGRLHHLPSAAVEVVDPVGAGDAFTAGYLAARLLGAGAGDAARLGSRLAAGVVATTGDTSGLPTPAEARELLARLGTGAVPEEAT